MKFEYKDHILRIEKSAESDMYLGTCSKLDTIFTWDNDYLMIIRSFVREVDSKLKSKTVQPVIFYKGHTLVVKKKDDSSDFTEWYTGTSKIGNKEWTGDGISVDTVTRAFKYHVDMYLKLENSVIPTNEILDSYNGYDLNITKMEDFLDLGRDYYIGKLDNPSMEWRGTSLEEVRNQFRTFIDRNNVCGLKSYYDHLDKLKINSKAHGYSPKKIEHELKDIRDLYYEVLGFNFATVKKHYFERSENE